MSNDKAAATFHGPMSDERLAEIDSMPIYAPTSHLWTAIGDLYDEVLRLRSWKAEAIAAHAEWEATWIAAGRPGRLGTSKAVGVREEVIRLKAALARVTDDSMADHIRDAWARANRYCSPGGVLDIIRDVAAAEPDAAREVVDEPDFLDHTDRLDLGIQNGDDR